MHFIAPALFAAAAAVTLYGTQQMPISRADFYTLGAAIFAASAAAQVIWGRLRTLAQ